MISIDIALAANASATLATPPCIGDWWSTPPSPPSSGTRSEPGVPPLFSLPAPSSPILPSPSSFVPSCMAALPPSTAASPDSSPRSIMPSSSFSPSPWPSATSSPPMPFPSWLFCFPPSSIPARGPVFFWAYAFYLSKLYELVDTLLILLSADSRHLSFLHVYHYAVVVVMCYLWLTSRKSLLPVALVTNASVHVVMYGYYLCSSLGRRWPPRWKRALTSCQIVQFCFSSSTLERLKASIAPAPTPAPSRPGPSFTRTPPTAASLHLLVVHSVVTVVISEQES
ncbi:hypothetical protein Taro_037227 [Colocasia esculenta]|uniref:very-long-chain 3-oxoacyl-CoA synthase n=1 Tax=Colocasia esculenta TaxID=4460 RepID=A0A843W555_COLES|nr:hypothetical protein [Colocasia esculenta]